MGDDPAPRRHPDLKRRLEKAGIEYVRILWCDNANVIRGKAAHVRLLAGGLPEGVGISAAQQALPVMYDAVVPQSGLGPIGEARLVPDWSTLHLLPWARTHAQVIGDMRMAGPLGPTVRASSCALRSASSSRVASPRAPPSRTSSS